MSREGLVARVAAAAMNLGKDGNMPALEYTVVEPVVFNNPDHRECVGRGHVWLVVTGEGWEAETLFSVWLMPGRSAVVRARGRIVIGTGSAADAVDTAPGVAGRRAA